MRFSKTSVPQMNEIKYYTQKDKKRIYYILCLKIPQSTLGAAIAITADGIVKTLYVTEKDFVVE